MLIIIFGSKLCNNIQHGTFIEEAKLEFERLCGGEVVTYRVIVVCILVNKFQRGVCVQITPSSHQLNKTLLCDYITVCYKFTLSSLFNAHPNY